SSELAAEVRLAGARAQDTAGASPDGRGGLGDRHPTGASLRGGARGGATEVAGLSPFPKAGKEGGAGGGAPAGARGHVWPGPAAPRRRRVDGQGFGGVDQGDRFVARLQEGVVIGPHRLDRVLRPRLLLDGRYGATGEAGHGIPGDLVATTANRQL